MNSLFSLMELALNWRLAGSASKDEHESILRTALTEALKNKQDLYTSQERVQNSPESVHVAQPVRSLNELERLDIVTNWFSDEADITLAMQMLTDFEQTTPIAQPVRLPLTDEQIETLRDRTFSINNPFCPVDSKSMRKAVRAVERAHHIGGDK